MFVDGKRQKGILTAVAFFIIMLLPSISHAQAGQLLSLYGMAGVECFSETVRAVPPVYRDRFTRALAGEQGKQVVDLVAERGFAPVPGSEMLVLGLPGGTMYAAVPLESDCHLPSLACSPEDLQQAGYDDRIYTRMLMGTVIEMQGANQRSLQGKRFLAKDKRS